MLTVINYHYLRENFDSVYPSIFGVTPNAFKSQLSLMKDKGEFLHPSDLENNVDIILHSKNNYQLVTFDDGLKEQFDMGLSLLDDLKVPAIFFVNSVNFENKKVSTVHKIHLLRSIIDPKILLEKIHTDFVIEFSEEDKNKARSTYRFDNSLNAELKYILNFKLSFLQQELIIGKMFENYFEEAKVLEELYMSHQNLLELGQRKYLGSHSHNHYPLGLTDDKTIKFELENSKTYLQRISSSNINLISYPYGTDEAATYDVAKLAKDFGYTIGFTTKKGVNNGLENHLLLNRFDCNDLPGGNKK